MHDAVRLLSIALAMQACDAHEPSAMETGAPADRLLSRALRARSRSAALEGTTLGKAQRLAAQAPRAPRAAISARAAPWVPPAGGSLGQHLKLSRHAAGPFQPSSSRQKLTSMRASAEIDRTFKPQTYGETKAKLQEAMPRLTDPLFQTFIDDILNELHFYVFNPNYKYDALFALGLREFFASGLSAYDKLQGSGQGEKFWDAMCASVGLDGQQLIKDADAVKSYAKSTSTEDILKNMAGTEKPSDDLLATAFEESKKHVRFRSIGLFTIMEFSGVQVDKEKAEEWSKAAKIDNDKFMKDLQNFRTNLRKIQEGLAMMKEFMGRKQKKAEKAKETPKVEAATATKED